MLLRDLRRGPCADCGEAFEPHQMDFDHRVPQLKSFQLTDGRAMLKSRAVLLNEIRKCDVVCANCHRMRTHARHVKRDMTFSGRSPYIDRKRTYWRSQAELLNRLRDVPCTDCNQRFAPCAMDFDHIDPNMKDYVVTRMIGRAGTARILGEVAKCDIVCANCHRRRTHDRRMVDRGAGVAQLVERQPSKLDVAGSNPVSRSKL
jgi:formate-dependent nitrite reductase cytochrome c552 subunit